MALSGTSGLPMGRDDCAAGLGMAASSSVDNTAAVQNTVAAGRPPPIMRLVGDTSDEAEPVAKPDMSPDVSAGVAGRIEAARQVEAARPSDRKVEWVRDAVGKFERPLTQYALHVLGGDLERARDLVQETFLRLCDQDEANVGSHLAEWLYTVCRNLAIDQKRKDRRMRLMTEEQEATFATEYESPTDAAERVDAYQKVVDAMAGLPARQQEIVRLKFQHGLSYKQIGQVMNITATNVGFILHTAMKTLRGRFGEVDETTNEEDAEGTESTEMV